MIRLVLCCALLLVAADAHAQDPQAADTPAARQPVSDEFVALFSSYCLDRFPDDGTLAARAAADGDRPLTGAEVNSFLHSDPGVGWLIAGREASYVLTVQRPPYHTCAIRRYSQTPLDGVPFVTAANSFAAKAGRKLAPPVARDNPVGGGIISSGIYFQELDSAGKPVNEAFMFFIVRYPAVARTDGTLSKPFWEIRFVRQIQISRPI